MDSFYTVMMSYFWACTNGLRRWDTSIYLYLCCFIRSGCRGNRSLNACLNLNWSTLFRGIWKRFSGGECWRIEIFIESLFTFWKLIFKLSLDSLQRSENCKFHVFVIENNFYRQNSCTFTTYTQELYCFNFIKT